MTPPTGGTSYLTSFRQTYETWTSRKEWCSWYEKSTLKSTAETSLNFMATLMEPPYNIASNLLQGILTSTQNNASIEDETTQKPAPTTPERFFCSKPKERSWFAAWFLSVKTGFFQLFNALWTFIKSPFTFSA